MVLEIFILLVILSLVMETVDASLGMMYGTILSPVLISMGFAPLQVIPAILLSQGLGGLVGSLSHHKFRNADFKGLSKDTKVALAMIIPGMLVTVLGVLVAVSVPIIVVKTYIAILVLVMSVLCLSPIKYKFAWWKHYLIGALAGFNKAMSGGGFGPVTSTGGIVGGLSAKLSVATTTLAEVFVCLTGFIVYLFVVGISSSLIIPLSIGALIGGFIGAYFCSKGNHKILRRMIGALGIISGLWLLFKIYG